MNKNFDKPEKLVGMAYLEWQVITTKDLDNANHSSMGAL
jgi:hypothetical protein